MREKIPIIDEARKVWDKIKMDGMINESDLEAVVRNKMSDFFHVGPFYFYLFDVRNARFTYISPGIHSLLGYRPEDTDIEFFLSRIHPDDQPVMIDYERAVVKFFRTLPSDKISKYKFSYDYRIRNSNDDYIRLLQQVVTVRFNDHENVLITLGVHTDISHIKKDNNSILSFIGLDGEPSFYDVNVKKTLKAGTDLFTKREREILKHLLAGEKSVDIADKLFISKHTVDTHRKNLLAKTSTKSTMELAAKLFADGLL